MKFQFRQFLCWLVIVFIVSQHCIANNEIGGNNLGDSCDWIGSGLSDFEGPGRGVIPVYLRCSQGHLEWAYPRGALRVLLRLSATGREFRGCIKLGGSVGGARVFLEGPRSLVPLFMSEDGNSQLVRCFQSRDAQAALYIEASPDVDHLKRVVTEFFYHLDPVPRGRNMYDSEEDCRPCNPDEMVRLYCTSDFVVRGTINSVQKNEHLSRSEISIRTTKVYRQLQDVFKYTTSSDSVPVDARLGLKNLSSSDYSIDNTIDEVDVLNHMIGTVYIPLNCGATHGAGEFMFMGRIVLGEPVLTCAPRLEDWILIRAIAIDKGEPQCFLET